MTKWTGAVYHLVAGVLWIFTNTGDGIWRRATAAERAEWEAGRGVCGG